MTGLVFAVLAHACVVLLVGVLLCRSLLTDIEASEARMLAAFGLAASCGVGMFGTFAIEALAK